jgi:rRNA maturation endonuclease Nob1
MPPRVSREEWDRRAAAVGIEWVGDEAIYASTKHVARCLTCGYEWSATPGSLYAGHGCPSCVGKAPVTRDEWDRRAAAVGIEWVGNGPIRSGTKFAARCMGCDHEWVVQASSVTQGHGCPACARNATPSTEEWTRRAAELGIEWVGNQPILARTKHAARCLTCAHEWSVMPYSVHQGRGCPACGGTMPVPRDEWDRRAAGVGIEWVGAGPIRADFKHPAQCLTCGHSWNATPHRVASGGGCPRCPHIARHISRQEWDRRAAVVGVEWIADAPASNTAQAAARCLTCRYEWMPWGVGIYQGHGCPACTGKAPVTRDEWDRRAAAVGIEWTSGPPAGTQHRARVRCLTCGFEYETIGKNVSDGSGCAVCAQHGFDPTQPSLVYLLRHDQGPLMKVGVTKIGSRGRLTGHRGRGWEQIATWPVPFGRDALAIEAAVIEWWRASGARACTRDEVPKGDGWTEAVHIAAAADEPRTLAYIEELVAEVGGGY